MASHAQPSRITLEKHFEVDETFLENLRLDGPSQDLMEISTDLVGRVYSKWRDFQSALRRRLGRPLEKQEIQLLRKHSKFVPGHAVLHLTVYDGSIAQAIQFEEQAYLQRFRELLPELPLGAIRCKVGDLGRTSHDQRGLEEMLSRWKNFNPDRFSKTVSRITSIGSTRAMPSLSSIAVLPLKLKNSGYILEDREC